MSRRHFTIACEEETLFGTLDDAPGKTGLLIVTGGNETRAGAFSGQSQLAARIAAEGFPVFRFDRRGVGDSTGENSGFTGSLPDIQAAIAAFRKEAPQIDRIVLHGNCDAASAIMASGATGANAAVVSNPWVIEDDSGEQAPPADAIRARYAAKLKDPRELLRLFTGRVSIGKLLRGMAAASQRQPAQFNDAARNLYLSIKDGQPPFTILLAGRDRTAQVFAANWPGDDQRLRHCADADHAFSGKDSREWYVAQLLSALNEQARQLDVG